MQVRRQVLLAATVLTIGLGPIGWGVAAADDRVTVMLRSGEKLSGRFDGVANDRFYLDISDTDERHIPMGDIAVIDLTQGANNLPETELSQARGGSHVLVTKSGDLAKGHLDRIEGSRVEGSDAATVRFRAEGGGERVVPMRDVARIYLGNYPGAAPSSPSPSQPSNPSTPSTGGTNFGERVVMVPANQQWVDSGLTVRQGQALTIRASGEVVLSADPNDKANPNGALSGRRAVNAPLPQTPAGALIGRIGNGQPFGIGMGPANINAPGTGRLYFGVNDDGMGDNNGQYEVRVTGGGTGTSSDQQNNQRNNRDNNNDNRGRRRRP
jgi:hypothetical protein